MEILLFYFFGAAVVGVLAHRKGRSGPGFFGLSLLISPILGFIAVLLAKPNPAKAEALRLSRGTERKCPFCAELVKAEAKICRFCGKDLPEPSAAGEPARAGGRRFGSREEYEAWKKDHPTQEP